MIFIFNFKAVTFVKKIASQTNLQKTINMSFIEDLALVETNFKLPGQTHFYRGKVRDVYTIADQLVMVASDRISSFDHGFT